MGVRPKGTRGERKAPLSLPQERNPLHESIILWEMAFAA